MIVGRLLPALVALLLPAASAAAGGAVVVVPPVAADGTTTAAPANPAAAPRASGAASVVSVELGRKTVWGFGVVTDVGDIDLSERGDGALKLAVPVVSETWVVTVTLSASALLYVGKIWLGLAAVTSKAPVRLRETRQGNAIVNVSDARTSRSARLASVTRSLDLAWSSISAAQRAELLAVFEALAGSGSRCVLVPDEQDMTAAYLGRISDSVSSEIDPARWWQGHGFGFTEEGRALGG